MNWEDLSDAEQATLLRQMNLTLDAVRAWLDARQALHRAASQPAQRQPSQPAGERQRGAATSASNGRR